MKAFAVATGIVAVVLAASAPVATAAPQEIAIINGLVYQDQYGDLARCISVGPMDITVENYTSKRTAYIYNSDDCTGNPVGTVAPGAKGAAYGITVDFKKPAGGGSFEW
ncbi:hypothetical protein [Nocardia brasiliensis]|uniref:Secreted protein n=1 Tax=Nocardia brasiliensis (strain ATCC 700358 / HUJEG-1) TaxID=1133849 RepID=K0EXT3_NOCB7|nr:hypothetical protein [Nocardia brasiliensis]AFU04693.1 hypothetical protein O3I_033720 [Nocardia brasiliensis ATCC 700358]OCF88328.1 hypothetical protein AW168_21820 [Nocardia brasiliensis]